MGEEGMSHSERVHDRDIYNAVETCLGRSRGRAFIVLEDSKAQEKVAQRFALENNAALLDATTLTPGFGDYDNKDAIVLINYSSVSLDNGDEGKESSVQGEVRSFVQTHNGRPKALVLSTTMPSPLITLFNNAPWANGPFEDNYWKISVDGYSLKTTRLEKDYSDRSNIAGTWVEESN